jgi:hypothetical protein
MKFTAPLLGLALTLGSVGLASAGPRIVISTGHSHGYCAPRPTYCAPRISYAPSISYRNCRPSGHYYSRPTYYSSYPAYSYPTYYSNYSGYPYSSSFYSSPSIGVSLSTAPIYTSYTRSIRSSGYDDDDLAISVQRALSRRGYYRGGIDGEVGPGTRAAIRQYQYDRRLEVTGRIDRSLLRSLGLS